MVSYAVFHTGKLAGISEIVKSNHLIPSYVATRHTKFYPVRNQLPHVSALLLCLSNVQIGHIATNKLCGVFPMIKKPFYIICSPI